MYVLCILYVCIMYVSMNLFTSKLFRRNMQIFFAMANLRATSRFVSRTESIVGRAFLLRLSTSNFLFEFFHHLVFSVLVHYWLVVATVLIELFSFSFWFRHRVHKLERRLARILMCLMSFIKHEYCMNGK